MIFYHADIFSHLREGQILDLYPARTPIWQLYPHGISSYGERAFLSPDNDIRREMQLKDIIFDYVRLARYPGKPSRFTSVFASARLADSKKWLAEIARDVFENNPGFHARNTLSIPIYEVQCSIAYIADARFLDFEIMQPDIPLDPASIFPYALAYWQSTRPVTKDTILREIETRQKPEILLVPPVRVLRRVDQG